MKKLLGILIFISASCSASTNQIDFSLGRGTPLGAVDAGSRSDRQGARGTEWWLDGLHSIGHQLYLGIGGGHFSSQDNISPTFAQGATSRISSGRTSTLILGRMDLIPGQKFALYGIAGVGWARNSLSITAVPTSVWSDTGTSETRTFLNDSANALGYKAGVGLDVSLTDALVLGIEADYEGSQKKNFSLTSQGAAATGQTSVDASVSVLFIGLKLGVKY